MCVTLCKGKGRYEKVDRASVREGGEGKGERNEQTNLIAVNAISYAALHYATQH